MGALTAGPPLMCGIAGLLDPAGDYNADALRSLARSMAATIAHRGPDDHGVWVDEDHGVAFGHRRLSIVDLSPAGHQPMVSADGRFVLVFNGEAYNHQELRASLPNTAWRGTSDTEVLLEAIAAWGIERALQATDGMFALALWDRRDRELTLARDRVGEKPLYYGWAGKTFVFGSELKALRCVRGLARDVDRAALREYIRYGYVPAPRSIYAGVKKLEPGSILDVAADGSAREPRPYWSFREIAEAGYRDPLRVSDSDAVDLVEEALARSVGLRMLADVPVGAFLSGGVDSSTIVALMQQQSPGAVRTFTIGFSDRDFDESAHAAAVAHHLGTDHTELRASADDALALIPTLARVYDEPFADSSQLPTLLVASLTRKSVTVGLSGDAGDELFGGYVRHAMLERLWARQQRLPARVRATGASAVMALRPATWDRMSTAAGRIVGRQRVPAHAGEKAYKLARVLRAATVDDAYAALASTWTGQFPIPVLDGGASRGNAEPDERTTLGSLPANLDTTERVMLLDSLTYLPDDILVKVDRASMSVSLESRVPMLDHRLVELVWRLPRHQRIRDGEAKWAMRRVLDRHVPPRLTRRPKMGFAVPMSEWLRGPLRSWAEELLDPTEIARAGYLDPTPIRTVWSEHLGGVRDHAPGLWSVLQFQAWLAEEDRAIGEMTRMDR